MSRILTAPTPLLLLLLALAAAAGCGPARAPRAPAAAPSIAAAPPPGVSLRPPADAILGDDAVGAPRRAAADHLTAAEAASRQPDQAAALSEYLGWDWLDGSTRTWEDADETVVLTARTEGAVRAFAFWAADAERPPLEPTGCSPAVGAGLDDCRV